MEYGRLVRMTHRRLVSGSAHAIVPVAPACPKVLPETRSPNAFQACERPKAHPSPHGALSSAFWSEVIDVTVAGLNRRLPAYTPPSRNVCSRTARSVVLLCMPPQGHPMSRQ